MKTLRLFRVIFSAAFLASTLLCLAQSPNVAGDYAGMSGPLHVKLHLATGPKDTITGTVDSPDQNLVGLPLTDVHLSGQSLSFSVPMVRGAWLGFVSPDGNSLTGTWNQGQSVPLNLTRVGANVAATPAAPPTPSPVAPPPVAASTGDACPTNSQANYWDGTSWKPLTTVVPLPRERGISITEQLKNPLNPMAGYTTIYRYKDPASSLTLSTTPKFCFPITVNDSPKVIIGVFDVKKDERDIELKMSDRHNATSMVPARKSFELDVKRGSNSFEATPKVPLPPGQYIINNAYTSYDFGVQ
jgi:hypothetical protein